MGALGLGIGGGFCLGGVAASGHALIAVAEPRATSIPTQRTMELASVAGAGLVGAGHSETVAVLLAKGSV
jgi:hypothetical protein